MVRFEASSQIIEIQPVSPTAQVNLLLVNESSLIDFFALTLSPPTDYSTAPIEPGWLVFSPPSFDLRPLTPGSQSREGETQQTIRVDINLPGGVQAGTYAGQFVITARSGPDNNAMLPFTLIVEQRDAQTLELSPTELTSRRSQAVFQVLVVNQGNAPHHYSLYAQDSDDKCRFELKPDEIDLAPGQQAVLNLKVRPRQRNWTGSDESYSFTVELEGQEQEVSGNFRQRCAYPIVGWFGGLWARFGVPLFIIVGLLIVALLFLPNFFKSQPVAACGPASLRQVSVISNDQTSQIYVSGRAGAAPTQLIATDKAADLPGVFASLVAVSPDGQRLAYVTANNLAMDQAQIWVVDMQTRKKQVLTGVPSGLWPTAPIWSADSQKLAFVSRPAQAVAVPASTAGGTPGAVTTTAPATPQAATNPDQLELWVATSKPDQTFEPAHLLAAPTRLDTALFYGEGSQVVCWNSEATGLIVWPKPGDAHPDNTQTEVNLADGKTNEVRRPAGQGVAQAASLAAPLPASNNCPLLKPYSQNDPRWANNALKAGTAGKLGDFGCAVTGAAMLLNSYGLDGVTPDALLNGCLGDMAAPLYQAGWFQIAGSGCSNNRLKGGSRVRFSWNDLDATLKNGPALVGLIGGQTYTHFLVVTSGHDDFADTYTVVDPWDGSTYKTLGYFLDKGYHLGWLVNFDGQAVGCTAVTTNPNPKIEIKIDGVQDGGLYQTVRSFNYNVSGTSDVVATVKSTGPDGKLPASNQRVLSDSQPTIFEAEGSYDVSIQAKYLLDHSVVSRDLHFSIDRSPPVITPTLSSQPDPKTKKYTNPVTLRWQAGDALSGISAIEYQINNGNWEPYTSDTIPNAVTLTENGAYDVNYRAIDGAGNVSPSGSLHLELEIPVSRHVATPPSTNPDGTANNPVPIPTTPATTGGAGAGGAVTPSVPAPGNLPTVTPAAPILTTNAATTVAAVAVTTTPPATPTPLPPTPTALPPTPTTTIAPTIIPQPTTAPPTFAPPPTPVPLTPGATVVTATTTLPITATTAPGGGTGGPGSGTPTPNLNGLLAVSVQLNFPSGSSSQLLTLNNNGNAPLTFNVVPGASASFLSFNPTTGTIAPNSSAVVNVSLLAPNLTHQNQSTAFQIVSSAGSQTINVVISPGTVSSATFASPTDNGLLDATSTIKLAVNVPTSGLIPDHATLIATYKTCPTCTPAAVTLPNKATAATNWTAPWDTSQLIAQSGITLTGKLCFSSDDSNCIDIPILANLTIAANATFSAPAANSGLQANTLVSVQASGRANRVIVMAVYQNTQVQLPDQPSQANNWTINWNTLAIPPNVPVTLKGQVCSGADNTTCQDITSTVTGLTTSLQARVIFTQDLSLNKVLPSALGITIQPVTNLSNGASNINHLSLYATYQSSSNSSPTRQLLSNVILQPTTSPPWQASFNTAGLPAQTNIVLEAVACFKPDESICQSLVSYSGLQIVAANPTGLTAVDGSGQSTPVNSAFPITFKVRVTDATNNPVSGVSVTFQSPGSGASGSFGSSATYTAQTDATGTATAAIFVANNVAGSYNVTASLNGSAATVSFQLTNLPGTSSFISAAGGTPQSAVISNTFAIPFAVKVLDTNSNPLAGVNVIFQAPSSINGGATGTFVGGAPSATATTNAQGIATAPTFTANANVGSYTLTASAGGLTVNFALSNLQSAPLSLQATPGTTLQSAQILTRFGTRLQVTARDAANNPVSGLNVTFTAPNGGASGTFTNNSFLYTVATDASGTATAVDFTANNILGSYTVAATAPSYGAAYFQLTNTSGNASSVTATSGTPQSTPISTTFATNLAVQVKDVGNNPLSGVSVVFQAPASGPSGTFAGGSSQATVSTNAQGNATAPPFTANGAAGSYTVTATVNGIANPANFTLTNSAGAPDGVIGTSGSGQSVPISTTFGTALAVKVVDAGNNPLSGVSVIFQAPTSGASGTFASSGNAANGGRPSVSSSTATVTTNAQGIATAPAFTANGTAGSYTVTASVAGLSMTASFALTNTAGPPATLVATAGTPQSTTLSTTFGTALAARVTDNGGNLLSGVTVIFTAPTTGGEGPTGTFAGGLASTSATTNTSGIATAPAFTANSVTGTYTVTATVSGVSGSASFVLTNQTGAPAQIIVAGGDNQTTSINTQFSTSPAVQVLDSGNNPVANVTVTFTAPTSGASGANLSGSTTITATTNASGIADSLYFRANGIAGSYTVTASVAGVATQASIHLTNSAGAPTQIIVSAGNNQSATINTIFGTSTVAQVLDSGNNPVSNVTVTFFAPTSGASGTFAGGSTTVTVTTNSGGYAIAGAFQANGTVGSYTVTASVTGVSMTASFTLTNTAGPPSVIVPTAGTPQSATISTTFGTALAAKVTDSGNNPLSGVTVTFTAPTTGGEGPTGTFAGGLASTTATTNASGIATASAFTANNTAGSYPITATVSGVSTPANFVLTNNNPVPTIGSISPTQAQAGGPDIVLTVNGSNFGFDSIVRFNGVDLTTSYYNPTQLIANVPSAALTTNGALPVSVFNPAPGGGTSGSQSFSSLSLTVGSYGLTCTESGFATALSNAATLGGGTITFNCPNPTTIPISIEYPLPFNTTVDGGAAGKIVLSIAAATARVTNNQPGNTNTLQNLEFTTSTAVTNTYGILVNFSGSLSINNSLFTGINTTSHCLYNGPGETMTVSNTVFDSNIISAQPYIEGCFSNWGTTTIVSSTFSNTFGSAIANNNGILSIVSSNFVNNNSVLGNQAGGIENGSQLSVSNSIFTGNRSSSTAGAIHNLDTISTNISSSTFNNNVGSNSSDGGAIFNTGTINITGSQFNNNSTLGNSSNGGAIANGSPGYSPYLTVSNSTFNNNSAFSGGGISNYGYFTLTTSTFYSNTASTSSGTGGGISNSGTLTATTSTFQNNQAVEGAAISNDGNLTIGNSTFTGNNSTAAGTVYNTSGTTLIVNSTIAANSNNGGIINSSGSFTIKNTIIASNPPLNCNGFITDGGHNLQFGDNSCGVTITVADPKLAPLANNGGPTKTMALQTGSAAINAGDNTVCASALIGNLDQRGNVRPGGAQPNCSIGAYEYP